MLSSPRGQTIIGTGLLENSNTNEASGGRCSLSTAGLGSAFAGRPRKRTIAAADPGFPALFRFLVDIATLTPRIIASGVWGKYLKNWYLLARKGLADNLVYGRPENLAHALRVSLL